MLRTFPQYRLYDADGLPVSRIFFAIDEASELDMASPDAGRVAEEILDLHYTSAGRADAEWIAPGSLDHTYGRLEASLDSDSGPWTVLSEGGTLADPTPEGDAGTIWLRYIAHRWGTAESFYARFDLMLSYPGRSAIDED